MTYTEAQINLIQLLRDSNVTWKAIRLALGKSANALKLFWARCKEL
jgi:hypothetical protein